MNTIKVTCKNIKNGTESETRRFAWDSHNDIADYRQKYAARDLEQGYIDYKSYTDAHRVTLCGCAYTFANLDAARVEEHVVVVKEDTVGNYWDDIAGYDVTVAPRFYVIAPDMHTGTLRYVHGTGRGVSRFETHDEAEKQLAKWKKAATKWWAEKAKLDAVAEEVARLILIVGTKARQYPAPSTTTQVGDIVRVRGNGYWRVGIVVETTATRVKVAYTTRSNANGDGTPYGKWVPRRTEVK